MESISAKMTSKGQITLPAALRSELALKPGDRVQFRRTDAGNYEMIVKPYRLSDLQGMLKTQAPTPTRDELRRASDDAPNDRAEELVRRFKTNHPE